MIETSTKVANQEVTEESSSGSVKVSEILKRNTPQQRRFLEAAQKSKSKEERAENILLALGVKPIKKHIFKAGSTRSDLFRKLAGRPQQTAATPSTTPEDRVSENEEDKNHEFEEVQGQGLDSVKNTLEASQDAVNEEPLVPFEPIEPSTVTEPPGEHPGLNNQQPKRRKKVLVSKKKKFSADFEPSRRVTRPLGRSRAVPLANTTPSQVYEDPLPTPKDVSQGKQSATGQLPFGRRKKLVSFANLPRGGRSWCPLPTFPEAGQGKLQLLKLLGK